jgi:hypothetical protein
MKQPNPYIISLCAQIEVKLGSKIKNINSAQKFSEILETEKIHISAHTVARLFGIVKPFRTPYNETLDSLSIYLDFKNWDDFCMNQTHIPFDTNFFLTESSDEFSLAVLQLALENEDFESLKLIFEKVKTEENKFIIFSAGEIIGNYIRKTINKDKILKFLSESEVGKMLYYECFVDEDNKENYFSEALIKHYLPRTISDYQKLFVYAFLIGQEVYKKEKKTKYFENFIEITNVLSKKKCHFHLASRWFECAILHDGFSGKLHDTWETHLTEILHYTSKMNIYEKAWVIARPLKALLHFNYKINLFSHKEFNLEIDKLIIPSKINLHSVSLYIIQLYWLKKELYINSKLVFNPFRIPYNLFLNEQNNKTAIEFGIAFLFASGINKKILEKNLRQYCTEKGNSWILKLIETKS